MSNGKSCINPRRVIGRLLLDAPTLDQSQGKVMEWRLVIGGGRVVLRVWCPPRNSSMFLHNT
ncbi:hypothetical protein E2C01_090375 [Portunus trituberculatus]|uniref:Uncharacterized protein n=1 Tax=Portunus trituberculatus TaxID=210409 RepID=A0A5B7JLN3_PORTR|nr:hypothetical protein [Portunus trituberculatus]